MGHEYYYLGSGAALTKVFGSEKFVCVDTRSLESLIYAIGHPIETNEVTVFRRFLSPGDLFLDIGANFGLYTALASEILAHSGAIYSFEANPHTFRFLKRTAMVNRLLWLPQHKFVNAAVSDSNGEVSFTYSPEGLGGGRVIDDPLIGADEVVVKTKSIAIDEFLPEDVKPDFVKIDVESHELPVLKGMVKTIARSTGIRILMEYYTDCAEVTPQGKALVEFVRGLGLSVCEVQGDGRLVHVPDGEIPTGNKYLFLTRKPSEDCARHSRSIVLRMKAFNYHPQFTAGRGRALQLDGTFKFRAADHQNHDEPTLIFGPYIRVPAGKYRVKFHSSSVGPADVRIVHRLGHEELAYKMLSDWRNDEIGFEAASDVDDLEIIVRRLPELSSLDLEFIEIEPV